MSLRTYIDPVSTVHIINSLNTAIDEAALVSTLSDMTIRIQQIEADGGSSERSLSLHKEIKILQIQINYIKDQASFS